MWFLLLRRASFSRPLKIPRTWSNPEATFREQLEVSVDKAFEQDVLRTDNLIAARAGFARGLLTIQFNFLTISGALIGVILANKIQPDAAVSDSICAAILWIVFALQTELLLNASNIIVLYRYREKVISQKYKIVGNQPICEWEEFYSLRHTQSHVLDGLTVTSISPSFILNVVIVFGASGVFWVASGYSLKTVNPIILASAVLGLGFNIHAFFRYLKFDWEDIFSKKKSRTEDVT